MAGDNDPRKEQENGQINQRNGQPPAVVAAEDTDSSDENNSAEENDRSGYELIPQNDIPNAEEEDNDENFQTLDEILRQIPPSTEIQNMVEESERNQNRELIQEREVLFSQPPPETQPSNSNLDMSKDQVETIRSAMAGFQLPASSIPPWASDLTEEDLQKMLQDKLSSRNSLFSDRK